MPKTPTSWTPTTKNPTSWGNNNAKNPTVFTGNNAKVPTAFSNADIKNPTNWTPPLTVSIHYLYTDHSKVYTDSTRGYTYLKPSGNTLNDKSPTAWSPA